MYKHTTLSLSLCLSFSVSVSLSLRERVCGRTRFRQVIVVTERAGLPFKLLLNIPRLKMKNVKEIPGKT